MKRNYKYLVILLVIICMIITGYSCTREDNGEPNQNVSLLKFYAPSNFKSRSDLRGSIYDDNSRKIFAKGDTDDYSTFTYIDVTKQVSETKLEDRINELNNGKAEGDINYTKKEHKSLEVYSKEDYETEQGELKIINYSYMTTIDNSHYTIIISGPFDKKDEVKELANKVFNSLEKETS